MSWFSSWFRSEEQIKDEVITKNTKFFINEGIWVSYLRADVTFEYIKRFIIHYMKNKNFQAISTGPFSVTFQQDISNRRCATVCTVVSSKKRIKFEYYDGDTLDPNSSTSVLFQSILLELASLMVDKNLLFGQRITPLEAIPTSLSTIADENTFMDPKKHFWVGFLRPECASVAKKVILRYCTSHRFSVDEGSDKLVLLLSNKELYLALKIIVGYNAKEELLIHAFYSSLPRPQKVVKHSDSDSDSESDSSEEPPQPPPAQSDPDLRKGDEEYFHSFLLGLGRQLAQHELLRSQAEEFNKKNALGRSKQDANAPKDQNENANANARELKIDEEGAEKLVAPIEKSEEQSEDSLHEQLEPVQEKDHEQSVQEQPAPEPIQEVQEEPVQEQPRELAPEPVQEQPAPEPVQEVVREQPAPEPEPEAPVQAEPVQEQPAPEPIQEAAPEPVQEEPVQEQPREPVQEPEPEPVQEQPAPEPAPVQEQPASEPVQESAPEPIQEQE